MAQTDDDSDPQGIFVKETRDTGEILPKSVEGDALGQLLWRLLAEREALDTKIALAEGRLCSLIAKNRALGTDTNRGRILWRTVPGVVDWKAVALAMSTRITTDRVEEIIKACTKPPKKKLAYPKGWGSTR